MNFLPSSRLLDELRDIFWGRKIEDQLSLRRRLGRNMTPLVDAWQSEAVTLNIDLLGRILLCVPDWPCLFRCRHRQLVTGGYAHFGIASDIVASLMVEAHRHSRIYFPRGQLLLAQTQVRLSLFPCLSVRPLSPQLGLLSLLEHFDEFFISGQLEYLF